ncbi:MAG: PDZ/DHR/GLGF domain-containing protein, partial [Actinomycetota bacterium]|nr:PDZ/DHR/GLGF domain-containing protein [Actinomycetota bacterium]
MSSRGRTLLVAALVAAALLLGGALLPVPYVALGPGPTFNTLGQVDGQALIDISGHETFPATGHL